MNDFRWIWGVTPTHKQSIRFNLVASLIADNLLFYSVESDYGSAWLYLAMKPLKESWVETRAKDLMTMHYQVSDVMSLMDEIGFNFILRTNMVENGPMIEVTNYLDRKTMEILDGTQASQLIQNMPGLIDSVNSEGFLEDGTRIFRFRMAMSEEVVIENAHAFSYSKPIKISNDLELDPILWQSELKSIVEFESALELMHKEL